MENSLNLERFKNFFRTLENTNNFEQTIRNLRLAITYLANYIEIGKFTIEINLPESIFSEKLNLKAFEIYKAKTYKEDPEISINIDALDIKNAFIINIYPTINKTFNKKEIEDLELISQICYNYCINSIYLIFIEGASSFDNVTTGSNMSGLYRFGEVIEGFGLLKNYTCAAINIKNFKFINKNIGIISSNNLLKQFFLFINNFIDEDEIIGRIGGDNFIAIIKKENIDEFLKSIYKNDFSLELNKFTENYKLDFRIGLYVTNEGDTFDESIEKATTALNMAKTSKEEKILLFDKNMLELFNNETQVIINFKNALRNNEFKVFYQPKVDARTNCLSGAEALVRWNKNGQIISPNNFIPILEKENIIKELDFYVLKTVCKNLKEWINSNITPVRTSINFSKIHLENPNFTKEVFKILDEYDIPGKYLEIEITETNSFNDTSNLKNIIKEFKEKDIYVSIDDFGTGYSFLSLIKSLDVSVIKLDKSFIDIINEGDFSSKLFVKNIVSLIKDLKIDIVAEGVENLKQVDFLRFIGCDAIQGYFFDKPLEKKVFEDRLKNKEYIMPERTKEETDY